MRKKIRLKCLFYPGLSCSVRTEMEKDTIFDKFVRPNLTKEPDETQIAMKLAEGVKTVFDSRWMYLANFCQLCMKKKMQDNKHFEKKMRTKSARIEVVAPTPPLPIPCPNCGKQILLVFAKYCPFCGVKLEKYGGR